MTLCTRCGLRSGFTRPTHGSTDMGAVICLPCADEVMAALRDDCIARGQHDEARYGWEKWQHTRLDLIAGRPTT